MDLNGKAALISGAGGGICRAIAVAFAEAGAAAVACFDTDTTAAAETARLVTAAGSNAISGHCNVADEGEVQAATQAAYDALIGDIAMAGNGIAAGGGDEPGCFSRRGGIGIETGNRGGARFGEGDCDGAEAKQVRLRR
jgi:NAD(P)-dependent dehydrogenase (short-subunit alcohol dehydrogenase family)